MKETGRYLPIPVFCPNSFRSAREKDLAFGSQPHTILPIRKGGKVSRIKTSTGSFLKLSVSENIPFEKDPRIKVFCLIKLCSCFETDKTYEAGCKAMATVVHRDTSYVPKCCFLAFEKNDTAETFRPRKNLGEIIITSQLTVRNNDWQLGLTETSLRCFEALNCCI